MDILDKENIFLMEFMVDEVKIEYKGRLDFKFMNAETCVGFSFLGNGPFFISEDDFIPAKRKMVNGCSGCGNIKNGKSILFSLTPQLISEAREKFEMDLEISKKTMPDCVPDKVFVGATEVSMVELFNQLLTSLEKVSPPCTKSMKQCFSLTGKDGDRAAQLSAYIRMSCFGKVIVTKFQMNLDVESVEYSSKEGRCMYKYNKQVNYPKDPCSQGSPCLPSCPALIAERMKALGALAKSAAQIKFGEDNGDGAGKGGRKSGNMQSGLSSDGGKNHGKHVGGKHGGGKHGGRNSDGTRRNNDATQRNSDETGRKGNRTKRNSDESGRNSDGSGRNSDGSGRRSSENSSSSSKRWSSSDKLIGNIPFISGPHMSGNQPSSTYPPCSPCQPCRPCQPSQPCQPFRPCLPSPCKR